MEIYNEIERVMDVRYRNRSSVNIKWFSCVYLPTVQSNKKRYYACAARGEKAMCR